MASMSRIFLPLWIVGLHCLERNSDGKSVYHTEMSGTILWRNYKKTCHCGEHDIVSPVVRGWTMV